MAKIVVAEPERLGFALTTMKNSKAKKHFDRQLVNHGAMTLAAFRAKWKPAKRKHLGGLYANLIKSV